MCTFRTFICMFKVSSWQQKINQDVHYTLDVVDQANLFLLYSLLLWCKIRTCCSCIVYLKYFKTQLTSEETVITCIIHFPWNNGGKCEALFHKTVWYLVHLQKWPRKLSRLFFPHFPYLSNSQVFLIDWLLNQSTNLHKLRSKIKFFNCWRRGLGVGTRARILVGWFRPLLVCTS